MTHQLISQVFYPAFRNPLLEQDHDGCVFPMKEGRLAYSTDSFVVDPIFCVPGYDLYAGTLRRTFHGLYDTLKIC